jgi:hypothetical protein
VRRACVILALVLLPACSRKIDATVPPAASDKPPRGPLDAAPPEASSPDSASLKPSDASVDAPAPSSSFDAGVNACRLVYGPVQQNWIGDAALLATDTDIELITHKAGLPSVTRLPLPPVDPPSIGKVASPETEHEHVSPHPCAVGGTEIFCMDAQGAITRTPHTGGVGTVIAKGRPGSRLAAATVAGSHGLVAYLAERKTPEMILSEAFASVDGAPPVRISEEGSGATVVALAPRGAGVVALLLDGRAAMTPVHARTIGLASGKLELGSDEVVFVGGGAERQTSGVLASGRAASSGSAPVFALVPVAGEAGFGMAAIHLGDPPVTEEKTLWSMYPNGLDPAPLAATLGASPIRIARVRPVEARADAPRGVELGKLDDKGTFTPYGMISTTGRVASLEVALDAAKTLWIYYTDASGSWLERRVCP